jgi:hypothetical protein
MNANKQFGFLFFCVAIAAWCAYDLWFAADPGTTGARVINYIMLFVAGVMIFGSILRLRSGK